MHTTETKSMKENEGEKRYTYKIVKSGDVIEIYQYLKEQVKKISDIDSEEKEDTKNIKQDEEKESFVSKVHDEEYVRKMRSIFRTKTRLKRLINSNITNYSSKLKDKFITLDFNDYVSREEVIARFKLFNKRLRYKYSKYDYQYIAVIERGTEGTCRLHLHCLFFGLPFIKVEEFQKIWKYGGVDMQAISEYNEVASYILKYVDKTLEDGSYIARGKKFYVSSMGLKKPNENFFDENEAKKYIEKHKKGREVIFETIFDDEYMGTVLYTKIRKPHKKDEELKKNQASYYDEDIFNDYMYDKFLQSDNYL